MKENRPYVLTIAGFDPSAGAGILADIKVFEQHQVYGLGICSALTIQTDTEFMEVKWLDADEIISQIHPLITKFIIKHIKVGIIKDLHTLHQVIVFLKSFGPKIDIIWDPVLVASAGFDFHTDLKSEDLKSVLANIALVTPNFEENIFLQKCLQNQPLKNFTNVLLKGGHNPEKPGTDILYNEGIELEIAPKNEVLFAKHGSGCVLSSAIISNLSLGYDLLKSCQEAKIYTEDFLNSNHTLLGYHNYDR